MLVMSLQIVKYCPACFKTTVFIFFLSFLYVSDSTSSTVKTSYWHIEDTCIDLNTMFMDSTASNLVPVVTKGMKTVSKYKYLFFSEK